MNFQNTQFITSAVENSGCPEWELPEVMVWGKSNVGKSSFINALTGINGISKVSATPGKTKTLNFFDVDGRFALTDVPGYGYASVSKSTSMGFMDFIMNYARERENLELVLFLLDSRHKPTSNDTKLLGSLLELDLNVIIIATKWDKLNQKQKNQAIKNFQDSLGIGKDDFIKTSSEKGLNFDIVKKNITSALHIK